MTNSRMEDYVFRFKNIFSTKQMRVTLYMAVVLWVAVVTQVIVNRLFKEELQITEAFIKSDTVEMQSSVEIIGEYPSETLNEEGKRGLINKIADAVGLKIDDDITVWEEDDRVEYFYFKQAKQALTEIKVVSMRQEEDGAVKMKHYIVVQLTVSKGIQSIDKYKKLLEDVIDKLGFVKKQITLKYEGNREGNLTTEQKREMATLLIDELQGEIAVEYDEGDLFTIYGYTGMINEYVVSMNNKINIQIAITYNELTNTTKITLATPVLNESW